MNYKETLLMPNTSFETRNKLGDVEKEFIEEIGDIYDSVKEKNKGRAPYVWHEGPPYANGNLHIGHAFTKILKDFINRYKSMNGFDVTFMPGFDAHGLPIETAVTKSGINRKEMPIDEFRKHCEEYAHIQINNQLEQYKRFNILADFKHPYITINKEYEAAQIEVFAKMCQKGLIYKGLKPVYWSPSSESALAEAEIEYIDKRDASIYVAFKVVKGNDFVNIDDNLVIWTTTPWTLPGNTAVAVNKTFNYTKVFVNEQNYIVAEGLLDSLINLFNWSDVKIISTFKGEELEGVVYAHPFMNKNFPVVSATYVTLDTGTGLVHTAPSYGVDDFNTGVKYNLDMVYGVDDKGVLTKESGMFEGLFYEDANKAIAKHLDELGCLLKLVMITHSYPHDWRTKQPIIFRATDQWFASVDAIKEELLDAVNEVKWIPSWGQLRMTNMLKDRTDWCISRQRAWGVPLPIFYNEDGSVIMDYDIMMHIAKLFKEFGSNIWFQKEAKDLLPKGYTNPLSPHNLFRKETDTMDVWFDSGSSHTAVLVNRGLGYPADLYLEGCDQYRGWFNSSLITGIAVHNQAPYKTVLSHGFVLDGNGRKMSKSLGNTVNPLEVIEKRGVDLLRLWVASTDYTEDVKISDKILDQVGETLRKIRNTYRFMLGNISDFNHLTDLVKYDDMLVYDKYMMIKLDELTKNVLKEYNDYNFVNVYKMVNNYINSLSTFYLDFIKDILYTYKNDCIERRSVQSVLYNILNNLIKLLAPIIPTTSEEVYRLMAKDNKGIYLCDMPKVLNLKDDAIEKDFAKFFELKDKVYYELEIKRNEKVIGKGLEAKVTIPNALVPELLKDYLKLLLIVSDVTIKDELKVEKFEGVKCERCWNYYKEEEITGNICKRCHDVIDINK